MVVPEDLHKVLVIGATGTIGKEAVQQAIAEGLSVRAGVRDPNKAAPLGAAGAELTALDLNRPESLDAALAGVDGVFVVLPFVEDLVAQSRATVDAARRHGVKMSALGADPDAPVFVVQPRPASRQDLRSHRSRGALGCRGGRAPHRGLRSERKVCRHRGHRPSRSLEGRAGVAERVDAVS